MLPERSLVQRTQYDAYQTSPLAVVPSVLLHRCASCVGGTSSSTCAALICFQHVFLHVFLTCMTFTCVPFCMNVNGDAPLTFMQMSPCKCTRYPAGQGWPRRCSCVENIQKSEVEFRSSASDRRQMNRIVFKSAKNMIL